MNKIMLPLILLGVMSTYSMAHEENEKEINNPEEITIQPSSKEKDIPDIKHSGGTNSQGCHAGSRPYHCH